MNTADIIAQLGGTKQVAYLTGCSRVTVWKWQRANSIPVHHWGTLIGCKLKCGQRLTLENIYESEVKYGFNKYATQRYGKECRNA